jgi:uncharacterized protein
MSFERVTASIPADAPGTATELTLFRIGPADAPTKIYMQAALHADEQPGIMAIHHLLPMLEEADRDGKLRARFSILPMVNPLGMSRVESETHLGRYDARSGTNFNRRWPDLFAAVGADIGPKLGNDATTNVRLIRQAVKNWLDAQTPQTAMQKLRHRVMCEAYDADYVLDLHCDNEALPHLFVTPDSMNNLAELADWMGSVAQLTAEDSGGGSFDEVWPSLWTKLRAAYPEKPIPFSATAATLEYRGQHDVFDDLGKSDAEGLFNFFIAKGFIDLPLPAKSDPAPAPSPLSATQMLRVGEPGLLAGPRRQRCPRRAGRAGRGGRGGCAS